jgi:hypothetical protein
VSTEARFEAEREATKSILDLYDRAKRSQELCNEAGMRMPEILERLLGLREQSGKNELGEEEASAAAAPVVAPSYSRPPEATAEWISIDVRNASVNSVGLAILRENGEMRFGDLNRAVQAILPSAKFGSVANVGTKLHGIKIDRTAKGWKLLNTEDIGIIANGRLWAPISALNLQDMAAHRRESTMHILKAHPTGLQTEQLVEELRKCSSWMRARVNKYLVKDDTAVLRREGKIKHRGNTKKWALA